ncbi:MAG: glycosyltransferase family 4 protein [Actinobacteria bacterium]|nr:glycosyltransferase family 4 protein [Actinomycetota bacterium]
MKIALVYDAVYPYVKGGGEKRYYEIGKGLSQKNHQVHFYGMKFWEGDKDIKRQAMYYHGICSPKPLYEKNGKRSIQEAIHFGFACFKLIKEDFDLIDCCNFPYFSLLVCKLISIIKKKPLYATWHEVWGKNYWLEYIGRKGYLGYFIEKIAALMPDKIISVSEHTTCLLKNNLNSKKPIYTVTNGIELDSIEKIAPAKEKSDIIFAGRLISHKNVDILIKSIKLIVEKNPDIKSLIIGDGPEKERLESLTQKLNLERNIKFLGFLENYDDVYALMKSSKIFILPSTREGFGIVALEANACGIPVLTIDHKNNAVRDLIRENRNGFICRLNEEEIAEKIIMVLENNSGRDMKKSCMDFAEKYDWNKIVGEIEEIYLNE